ncbi:hypothetical protein M0R45_024212 [Rubus argutus]|uniref:Uncharacterized protein n=1 Tax=Rubus argutus TaxID=59490 RepID=A0AAW1WQX7_RUBAR
MASFQYNKPGNDNSCGGKESQRGHLARFTISVTQTRHYGHNNPDIPKAKTETHSYSQTQTYYLDHNLTKTSHSNGPRRVKTEKEVEEKAGHKRREYVQHKIQELRQQQQELERRKM